MQWARRRKWQDEVGSGKTSVSNRGSHLLLPLMHNMSESKGARKTSGKGRQAGRDGQTDGRRGEGTEEGTEEGTDEEGVRRDGEGRSACWAAALCPRSSNVSSHRSAEAGATGGNVGRNRWLADIDSAPGHVTADVSASVAAASPFSRPAHFDANALLSASCDRKRRELYLGVLYSSQRMRAPCAFLGGGGLGC